MAKKRDQEQEPEQEPNFKKTLNDIDKMWIENHPKLTPQQLVKKFASCYGDDKVPSIEAITQYREKYLNKSGVTTARAKGSDFTKKGTAIIMTQGNSERDDERNKTSSANRTPPWVTKIFQN